MTGLEMEALFGHVIGGLIAHVISSVLIQMGHVFLAPQHSRESLVEAIETHWDLKTLVQKSAVQVARAVGTSDRRQVDKIKTFLTTSEVEAMLKQVFACELLPSECCPPVGDVGKLFEASFILHTGIQNSQLANQLFDALVMATQQAIKAAADKGILGAHESLSSLRHQKLVSPVGDLQANLDLLVNKRPDIARILDFEEKYQKQVAEKFRLVSPPNFDRHKRFPIADLYVPPHVYP